MKKKIVCFMYDFDKTLATHDMQEFGLIPALGYTPSEFWALTEDFCIKNDCDRILGFMYVILEEAKKKNIKITREFLVKQGKVIKYYDGLSNWFSRINEYAKSKGLIAEHYLITSGNKEIVMGSQISKEFKNIFGCEYIYDPKTDEAVWPKTMINYTQKTQYIFRISKGVSKIVDDNKVNEHVSHRRIDYRNMIYLGDGLTDVPCMILVKNNGGNSIAVYKKGQKEKVYNLLNDGRVNYICKADYTLNSELDKVTKLIIDSLAINAALDYKIEKDKN
ncbi:MAG: HAD family hydrolase [Bacilli bacterium]